MTSPTCCAAPKVKYNGGNPICLRCGAYQGDRTRPVLPAALGPATTRKTPVPATDRETSGGHR